MCSLKFNLPFGKYLILKLKKKKGQTWFSLLVECPTTLTTQSVIIMLSSADLRGAMLCSRLTANC